MVAFGTAVVTLTHYVNTGTPDELGEYQQNEVNVAAPNCRHRPLTFQETIDLGIDIATQPWRTTLPTHTYSPTILNALAALNPNDVIKVNGQDYQIIGGERPFDDLAGNPFKATIISQKQIG